MGDFYRNYVRKNRVSIFWIENKHCKTKKWTFFKGVGPWVLSKNRTVSYWRYSQKSYQKRSFFTLWKEKNDFKWKKLNF